MAELLLALRLLLALILYTFLGLAFWMLRRSLQQGEVEKYPSPTPAQLIWESEEETEERCPAQAVMAIGRAADNTLALQDPFASTHHALILWREGQWWLEDLHSHNGTYLNEKQLTAPQPLASGDQIRIGQTTLRFEIQEKNSPNITEEAIKNERLS